MVQAVGDAVKGGARVALVAPQVEEIPWTVHERRARAWIHRLCVAG